MSEREPTVSEDMAEVATVLLFARDGQEPFARIQAHVESLEERAHLAESSNAVWSEASEAVCKAANVRYLVNVPAYVEALEGALRFLLKQVDEVERSSVIRESDTYRHARAALAGESEEVRHG